MYFEYSLFLDDVRESPQLDYIVARSYEQAIQAFEVVGCPNFISFDHDLGLGKSGYDVAKWMVEKDLDAKGTFIPKVFRFRVHSSNPPGAENITELLNNYLKHKVTENVR